MKIVSFLYLNVRSTKSKQYYGNELGFVCYLVTTYLFIHVHGK